MKMSMVEILFKACAFETRWGNEKGEIMSNIDKYETRKKMVYAGCRNHLFRIKISADPFLEAKAFNTRRSQNER